MTLLAFVPVIALLVLSAALSAAEAAIFAVGAPRLRTLVEEGFRGARALSALRADPQPVALGLFVVNMAVNATAIALAVAVAHRAWALPGAAVAGASSLVLVLAVGETLPRALAARHPIRFALVSAPALALALRAVRPLLAPLAWLLPVTPSRHATAEPETEVREAREVRELAALGRKEGVVDEQERQLVERAFRLDELRTWDVMTPRVDIFAWPDQLTLEQIVGELKDVPYSRVPIYHQTIDDVTGVLYIRDAYQAYVAGRGDARLQQLSREPFFVPGSLPLTRLLRAFQTRRIHMGIVADEFGGTDGLVTLEDVLEELVGEIADETDVAAEEPIVRVSRTEIVVDGGVDLREINHAFNVSLPHLEHRSLNGYIQEELGRVPDTGETFERAGLSFEIVEATETQVVRARLKKLQAAGDGEAA
ncbi:MAG: HlyC/CorC family transporter [Gemmatimonadetes bacterium]|nr:HlyC/CorC family transporter [Gemmatimonadota bacterium]